VTIAEIRHLTVLLAAIIEPVQGAWGVSHGFNVAIIVALLVYLIMPGVVKALPGGLFR